MITNKDALDYVIGECEHAATTLIRVMDGIDGEVARILRLSPNSHYYRIHRYIEHPNGRISCERGPILDADTMIQTICKYYINYLLL